MDVFSFKKKRNKNYFEGYYLRLVSKEESFNLALIFGVTFETKDPHAFVQVGDGILGESSYIRYELSDFSYDKNQIQIGPNILTRTSVNIDLKGYHINCSFDQLVTLQKKYGSKSAMGFLHIFPMKTYQEIVYMDGRFEGNINQKQVHGVLYMEKTFGYQFPKNWIWIQSNHFKDDILLSVSLGKTRVLGIPILGYIISIIIDNVEHRYATYNRSKIKIETKAQELHIQVKNKRTILDVYGTSRNPLHLVGPIRHGKMTMDVYESLDSSVRIRFQDQNKVITSQSNLVAMENMYED